MILSDVGRWLIIAIADSNRESQKTSGKLPSFSFIEGSSEVFHKAHIPMLFLKSLLKTPLGKKLYF